MYSLIRSSGNFTSSIKKVASPMICASFHNSVVSNSEKKADIVTHTGQVWEADDIRMVRFEVAKKQVNQKWAIDLINEVPPKPVKERIAVCEGGPSEALGHPKIYINVDEPGNHSCGYCGLRYYKEDSHH